jgi:hypothetical protein
VASPVTVNQRNRKDPAKCYATAFVNLTCGAQVGQRGMLKPQISLLDTAS